MYRAWWPLACSWLLMGIEMPLFAAVAGRLPDETVQLAAFSSIVFPVALLVEAPIIMLLAAATALVKDTASYGLLRRFTWGSVVVLTVVHGVVAFTGVFDAVVAVVGVPDAVVEPARLGLQIMLPWTGAIAYRRFCQGVLIGAGRSRAVVVGTVVRLIANGTALAIGVLAWGDAARGVAVGAAGFACGVLAEAIYAAIAVRDVVRGLPAPDPAAAPLDRRGFIAFYVPLAVTPLMTLVIQPIGAAAMSRLPQALDSLAVWPALYGFVFMLRSAGFAFNEVVVALRGERGAENVLFRFAIVLAAVTSGSLLLLAMTPLGGLWFERVSDLDDDLAALAAAGLWVAVLMPGYAVLQSWYQGTLVWARKTRGVTEAVGVYLGLTCVLLAVAVETQAVGVAGLFVALAAFTVAGVCQTVWLRWRCRRVVATLAE